MELFVGVADELHFGRAAERLFIAQSALSQHIRRLEREVGADLLDRGKRRIRLTPAGTAFYTEARRVLERADAACRAARVAATGRGGVIEVAFVSAAPPAVLAGLATRTRPQRQLRLNEQTATRIEAALDDGHLDVAVLDGVPQRAGVQGHIIDDEPLVAVMPAAFVPTDRVIDLATLADRTFVVPDASWVPRLAATVVEVCRRAGLRLDAVTEARSPDGWMIPIVAGHAVTLAPASIVNRFAGALRSIAVADPTARAVTSLVWRAGAPPNVLEFASTQPATIAA
jgi:DNA-binding transcriptional LysR family regulator